MEKENYHHVHREVYCMKMYARNATQRLRRREGRSPTLDTSLRMEGNNQVSWRHYEKPTTTNVTVLRRSAMGENIINTNPFK